MPVIRDIQLSFLKVKEHTRNIEALQLTSKATTMKTSLLVKRRAVLLLYIVDICQS